MPNFRKKPVVVHGEIMEDRSGELFVGDQFDATLPFPAQVVEWTTEDDPGDSSVGYIESRKGRLHLRDTDWLFADTFGNHFIVLDKALTTYYTQI